ncbi:MAG: hypothetical protein BIP78_0227 [Candidatus Bipolaricaulis sibiricus]|uniref:Uncharacterized protein n=1 Tax=Bipolaricaulis sibiricus TaxID=2501609 RepID=A0A410FSC4_BIPS1|nr:MAG: hypothetical protein BIP78_0227 [Candidatus Bipolaricaulis sibiricus]
MGAGVLQTEAGGGAPGHVGRRWKQGIVHHEVRQLTSGVWVRSVKHSRDGSCPGKRYAGYVTFEDLSKPVARSLGRYP